MPVYGINAVNNNFVNINQSRSRDCQNSAYPIVKFKGSPQENNGTSNPKMPYYIGGGVLVAGLGALIATLCLRKPNAAGKTISTTMTKEIEKMYDGLVEFVGVKRKPKLEFTTNIDKPKNFPEINEMPSGFYNHATNTIKINPDILDDKHILLFRNRQNPQQVIPHNKFAIQSDMEKLSRMSKEEKENFMRQAGFNPEEYSMETVKPTQPQIKAYLLRTLLHELRHAKQYESIHRTFGFEKVVEAEMQSGINDLSKNNKAITAEVRKQVEQEVRDGFKGWKDCPVDIDINSKEGQLAKKLFGSYAAHDHLGYNKDPFEIDAYQFESSPAVIDYVVKLTGIPARFVDIK